MGRTGKRKGRGWTCDKVGYQVSRKRGRWEKKRMVRGKRGDRNSRRKTCWRTGGGRYQVQLKNKIHKKKKYQRKRKPAEGPKMVQKKKSTEDQIKKKTNPEINAQVRRCGP